MNYQGKMQSVAKSGTAKCIMSRPTFKIGSYGEFKFE